MTVILLGFIALAFAVANGFPQYAAAMPLVGSNSAAISAACHVLREDVDASVLTVMWGVVKDRRGWCGITRCRSTSFEVELPETRED